MRPTRLTITLGRIRACIDHAAPLHDRSDRCALHAAYTIRTAPPPNASPPPCAHLQLSSTRVRRRRQQREAQTVCVCPRASSYLTLAATAPGRVQRHWRVNSDTRDRTNRLPEHCRATRKTPAKSRRDGMLVVLPATIYTCNGVWYNQPSSTERFRYVLLPARIMRRRRPLRLFRRVSSYCDFC